MNVSLRWKVLMRYLEENQSASKEDIMLKIDKIKKGIKDEE